MSTDAAWPPETRGERTTGGDPHNVAHTLVVPSQERNRVDTVAAPNGLSVGPTDDPDRFDLVGLGLAGGEGITWCGNYAGRLNHPVTYAIKQLQPPGGNQPDAWPTPADLRRWQDQRFVLQSVTNEHVVRLVDIFLGPPPHRPGDFDRHPLEAQYRTPYLVMEWVDGLTVAERVSRRLDPVGVRMTWILDIAEALESLHSESRTSGNPMLHRDVKPENCIVHPQRGAVLVDVGALRGLDDGMDPRGLHTERYAAPEVLADAMAPRTTASDLYSLGALAYYCLVGDDPPCASQADAAERMRRELSSAVVGHRPADVAGVVDTMLAVLARDPTARPSRPLAWARSLVEALARSAAQSSAPASVSASASVRADAVLTSRHRASGERWRWGQPSAAAARPNRRIQYAGALAAVAVAGIVATTRWPDPAAITSSVPPESAGAAAATSVPGSASAGFRVPSLAVAEADVRSSATATGTPRAVTASPVVAPSSPAPTAGQGRPRPGRTPAASTPTTTTSGPTTSGPATSSTGSVATGQQVQSMFASRCVDVHGPSTDDGTPLQLWDCINVPEERWSWDGGRVRGFGGKCLDVRGPSTDNGTPVQLFTCVDGPQQQWTLTADGELRVFGSKCLDVRGPENANGVALQIWDCVGVPQQKWRFY